MIVIPGQAAAACRRSVAPACEPPNVINQVGLASPPAPSSIDGGMLYVRVGDILDVGIDWSQWCTANDAKILTSVWSAYSGSPQSPTVASSGIDTGVSHTVAILDASAAAWGDTYWLKNVVTFGDAGASPNHSYAFPTRTLTRMIMVKVVL